MTMVRAIPSNNRNSRAIFGNHWYHWCTLCMHVYTINSFSNLSSIYRSQILSCQQCRFWTVDPGKFQTRNGAKVTMPVKNKQNSKNERSYETQTHEQLSWTKNFRHHNKNANKSTNMKNTIHIPNVYLILWNIEWVYPSGGSECNANEKMPYFRV